MQNKMSEVGARAEAAERAGGAHLAAWEAANDAGAAAERAEAQASPQGQAELTEAAGASWAGYTPAVWAERAVAAAGRAEAAVKLATERADRIQAFALGRGMMDTGAEAEARANAEGAKVEAKRAQVYALYAWRAADGCAALVVCLGLCLCGTY